jgi:hypothetical protein
MTALAKERARDICGAAILCALGLATAVQSQSYRLGTLTRMGPGFVPAALGVILVAVGIVLFVGALLKRGPATAAIALPSADAPFRPEWRGWICICLGVLVFAGLAERAGLIPAAFACVFVSALGDRDNGLRDAVLLAVAVTAAAVAIFWWGLGVVLPLVAWDF